MSQKSNSVALIDLGCVDHQTDGHEALERTVTPFRRVGRQTLLERTVRRLSESSLLDKIAIVGDKEFSGLISQSCIQPAQWFPCDAPSCAARAWHVAEELNAEWIVTVRPTSVFVDAILIDRLLSTAWGNPKCDMVAFMSQSNAGQYASSSRFPHGLCVQGAGLAGDVCHRRVLKRLLRDASFDHDPRGLSQLLVSMPEVFQTRLIPLPAVLDHTDLRFTLDCERDLDRALMIIEATGEDFDFRDVIQMANHLVVS